MEPYPDTRRELTFPARSLSSEGWSPTPTYGAVCVWLVESI